MYAYMHKSKQHINTQLDVKQHIFSNYTMVFAVQNYVAMYQLAMQLCTYYNNLPTVYSSVKIDQT